MDHPSEAEKGESRAVNEYANWPTDVTGLLSSLIQCVIGNILPLCIY